MRRTVERELARARLRHQGGRTGSVPLSPVVDAIIKTLKRTPDGEILTFENTVADDFSVPIHRDDLAEILGNLLENAARAASRLIRIKASVHEGNLSMTVKDDGSGLDEQHATGLLMRGKRQDEKGGSAGLGLAIVGDITAAYGADIRIQSSEYGGLSVTISLRS